LLEKLNPQQQAAVRHVGSPLLVLAGAGSGKTGVITHKVAWLIRERGMRPAHITAVTFTNKAAREMRSRLRGMLPGAARGLTISTFHTLGLNILRREHDLLGYRAGFSIIDPQDGVSIVRELLRGTATSSRDLPEQVYARISRWKNAARPPQDGEGADDPAGKLAARLYPAYERQLHACNAVDLDDLILKPARLFTEHPEALERWRTRIRYLLVDEYQDTNRAQYELVRLLVGDRNGFTAVGDDDQSIYAWRGAEAENLALLLKDFPNLEVVKLEQNYRSTARILKAANQVISNNHHVFEKRLWSALGHGDPLCVIEARNEEHEAQRVVSGLLHQRFQGGLRYGDFAILYRGNHQARLFEKILREQRIPYYLSGGLSFFDRSEVKDVMAYLRLVANHDDDTAFLRIVNTPRRGIGPGTLEKLGEYAGQQGLSLFAAASHLALDQRIAATQLAALRQFVRWIEGTAEAARATEVRRVVNDLLDQVALPDWIRANSKDEQEAERRLANIAELIDWFGRAATDGDGDSLADRVAALMLQGILDRGEDEPDGDQVSLMTIHAAKGLEFPYVYIVGVEEGLLPHQVSVDEGAIEEERRLFYVALTRAQRGLTLSYAANRRRFGETIDCEPSRFLEELPAEDFDWQRLGREVSDEERLSRGQAHLERIKAMLG